MTDYLGQDIPKLGFGLMRLPKRPRREDEPKPAGSASGAPDVVTDVDQVKQMVDEFLAAGFTYFDTARAYGDSEEVIRQALVERYPRESYQLATKNAAWLGAKNAEDAKAMLETSLRNTGAGYVDFYLLHNLGGSRTQVFEDYGMWEWVARQKDAGLVKHVGISFHDRAPQLKEVLDQHGDQIEFVQLQINYSDWDDAYVQSGANYRLCREYGKPVIVMEPVKGGLLAQPPAAVKQVFDETGSDASYSSWALRFAGGLEGLITVLSGMSSIEQMRDNLATFKDFKPLTADEREVIGKAQATFGNMGLIQCTSCRYCTKGCPKEINIPAIFNVVNTYRMFNNLDQARRSYDLESAGKLASSCIECGQCERACPQGLPIIDELKAAAALFE